MELKYTIKTNTLTINQILQNNLNMSSALLHRLIKTNNIKLNNLTCNTKVYPQNGDILTINFNYKEDTSNIIPTKMNLDIVFEDDWFLIINKPPKIVTHPSILHYSDSLSNGIRFYFDTNGLYKKIRPVNRLDANTSGLIVFAKCEYIQECLISQMKANLFRKEYLCICEGIFKKKSATINLPIARKEDSIIERCISEKGQTSITHYEVLEEFDNYSLVKCLLETGRTHQIRVHMSAIGHPLIGDTLYGSTSNIIDRQALHCYKLQFLHPITNNIKSFKSELPMDLKKLILNTKKE